MRFDLNLHISRFHDRGQKAVRDVYYCKDTTCPRSDQPGNKGFVCETHWIEHFCRTHTATERGNQALQNTPPLSKCGSSDSKRGTNRRERIEHRDVQRRNQRQSLSFAWLLYEPLKQRDAITISPQEPPELMSLLNLSDEIYPKSSRIDILEAASLKEKRTRSKRPSGSGHEIETLGNRAGCIIL